MDFDPEDDIEMSSSTIRDGRSLQGANFYGDLVEFYNNLDENTNIYTL